MSKSKNTDRNRVEAQRMERAALSALADFNAAPEVVAYYSRFLVGSRPVPGPLRPG